MVMHTIISEPEGRGRRSKVGPVSTIQQVGHQFEAHEEREEEKEEQGRIMRNWKGKEERRKNRNGRKEENIGMRDSCTNFFSGPMNQEIMRNTANLSVRALDKHCACRC